MKPRKITVGLFAAMFLVFAAAQADAKKAKPTVTCSAKKNKNVDHNGADGSECFASSDGSGKAQAKSNATGDKSFADAEVSTSGKSKATATGGSFSEAVSDTGGKSTSKASSGGSVTAASDEHGVAKGTASGSMSEADSSAFGKCNATSTATGAGSFATADCESNGTFAQASATGGGDCQSLQQCVADMYRLCRPDCEGYEHRRQLLGSVARYFRLYFGSFKSLAVRS